MNLKAYKVNTDSNWNQFLMAFSVVLYTYHILKSMWKNLDIALQVLVNYPFCKEF